MSTRQPLMLTLSPRGPLADFWPVPPTSHLRAVLYGYHWWWNQGKLDTTDFQPTVESPNLPNSPRPHGSKVLCNFSAIFPEFCWCEECPFLHLNHLDSATSASLWHIAFLGGYRCLLALTDLGGWGRGWGDGGWGLRREVEEQERAREEIVW